jgi:hypothetical protein
VLVVGDGGAQDAPSDYVLRRAPFRPNAIFLNKKPIVLFGTLFALSFPPCVSLSYAESMRDRACIHINKFRYKGGRGGERFLLARIDPSERAPCTCICVCISLYTAAQTAVSLKFSTLERHAFRIIAAEERERAEQRERTRCGMIWRERRRRSLFGRPRGGFPAHNRTLLK